MAATILDDTFADGTEGWTITNGVRSTSTGYDDSYSLRMGNNGNDVYAYKEFDSDGVQSTSIQFYMRETSNSTGSAVVVQNSKDQIEVAVATDNPELNVYDGNGWNQLYDGNGYDRWVRKKITFDWTNGQYDLEWEDLSAGDLQTFSNRPLRKGTDTAELRLRNQNGESFDDSSSVDSWYDVFTVNVPGGTISGTVTDDDGVAMGSETVEVLDASTGAIETTTTTASDGTYQTSELAVGDYNVYVRKPAYDTGHVQDVTVSENSDTTADVTLTATTYATTTDASGDYSHQLPVSVQDQIVNKSGWSKNEEDPFVLNGPVTVDYTLRPNPLTVGSSLTGVTGTTISASDNTPNILIWMFDFDWDNPKSESNVSHPSDVVELDSGIIDGELEAHEKTLEVEKQ